MQKIRKAVIPVAGFGTRCLPATKAVPKEMLPVVDRPVVQYAVDEAFQAGIEHIVFVTGRGKSAIEDYFDNSPELRESLEKSGKTAYLKMIEEVVPPAGSMTFTRQQSTEGLGHAIWCARAVIGDEPFAILLPDMVSFGKRGCLAETLDLYDMVGGNVIAVERCDPRETHKYGIVARGEEVGPGFRITGMVEKPEPASAPSNYYINGRYILQPTIFDLLEKGERGAGNEIQLTDAMLRLLEVEDFSARPYDGRMFDCGSKEGLVEANIAFALSRLDTRRVALATIERFGASAMADDEAA